MFACCCGEKEPENVEVHRIAVTSTQPLDPVDTTPSTKQTEPMAKQEDRPVEALKASHTEITQSQDTIKGGISREFTQDEMAGQVFQVAVDKAPLGLTLDMTSSGLLVSRVQHAHTTKEPAGPDGEGVKVFDIVVEVNGTSDLKDMVKLLKAKGPWRLTVTRPKRFKVKIQKDAKVNSLGLNLGFHLEDGVAPCRTCLEVQDIVAGAVQEYNNHAPAHLKVRVGDFIQSVNNVNGPGPKMIEEMRSAADLEIGLLRVKN